MSTETERTTQTLESFVAKGQAAQAAVDAATEKPWCFSCNPRPDPAITIESCPACQKKFEQEAMALIRKGQQLRRAEIVPVAALQLLRSTGLNDTGGSRATRNILRWLVRGQGGLEMRALDFERLSAVFEVIRWWAGPCQSHEPLEGIVEEFHEAHPPEECPMCRQKLGGAA